MQELKTVVLTENANYDQFSDQDYRDMIDEIKSVLEKNQGGGLLPGKQASWPKIIEYLGSDRTPTEWSGWYKGERKIFWDMKNVLRAAFGEARLPEPVKSVLEREVCESAQIVTSLSVAELSDEKPVNYVFLGKVGEYTTEQIKSFLGTKNNCYIGNCEGEEAAGKSFLRADRLDKIRPSYLDKELNEKRKALAVSWEEVVLAGIEYLAIKKENKEI